jgi:hypothetical protein
VQFPFVIKGSHDCVLVKPFRYNRIFKPPSILGLNCESEIDECAAAPCHNNATCIDMLDAFDCVCRPGFNGKSNSNDELLQILSRFSDRIEMPQVGRWGQVLAMNFPFFKPGPQEHYRAGPGTFLLGHQAL